MMSNAAPLPPTMVELALHYAAQGFRVFPLNGKVPAIPGGSGCLDATTDAETIREMWRRYPNANVGLAAGPESDFFAIDLDGPDARRAWMRLTEANGTVSTRTARTGREEGGLHLFFRWPGGGVPNRPEGAWSERVLGHRRMGVIGDGRYVVGAGSIHPETGQQYDWMDERIDLAEAPAWLIAKIRDEQREVKPDPWALPSEPVRQTSARYVEVALENEFLAVARAQEGERNNQLNTSAFNLGQLVGAGELHEAAVHDTLLSACRANGLLADDGERTCRNTITSGVEGGKKKPRAPRPKDDEGSRGVHAQPEQLAPPAEISLPDMAAVCRSLPGKHKRIPTYCAPLDAATGGGFQTGRIVVIGGPPGVTKTGWVLAMSYAMTRLGAHTSTGHHEVHVHVIAADEPRDGLLSRLGQMEGMERSVLEDEDVAVSRPAWEHVAACLERVPQLTVWDTRVESLTVEDIARFAAARATAVGARLVIVVDSIKEAPFSCDDMSLPLRERVDARMAALRRITIECAACVIAISELNRAAYSGKDAKADLGSFKESGGIEYKADLALTMARVEDPDFFLVEVTMQKSRVGDDPVFRLRRDTKLCTFEVHQEPEAAETAAEVLEDAKLEKLCNELVLALVRAHGPVSTRNDLGALVPARKADVQRAVSRLITQGRIEGGKGVPFRVSRLAEDSASE